MEFSLRSENSFIKQFCTTHCFVGEPTIEAEKVGKEKSEKVRKKETDSRRTTMCPGKKRTTMRTRKRKRKRRRGMRWRRDRRRCSP